jgi:hypothetical protein
MNMIVRAFLLMALVIIDLLLKLNFRSYRTV